MQFSKGYIEKIFSILRVHARADGLEVSDQVLRLIFLDKDMWHMEAVRLAPGVMEKGEIKDAPAFGAALRELRAKIPAMKGREKKMNIFVALSSVNMYSQVFTLPFMEEAEFKKAIELNVQMVSPVDISRAYFGWQFLGRDEKSLRSEIAAAFVDRGLVDEMVQALYAAGFITVGIESRALALVRTLREKGVGVNGKMSYLLINIDNSGIDFLIIREGKLYFEYQNFWADLADEKGLVFVSKFEEMLTASVRQVLNFYSQHWTEPLAGVILSAMAFKEEAERAIGNSSALPIIQLSLEVGQQIPQEWFVALGCGLRGLRIDEKDTEINLSGSGAMDTFHAERMLNFLALWRVLIPAVLGCLIIMFALADNFLSATKASIEASAGFSAQSGEGKEIAALVASSTAFNESVALAAGAEAGISHNYLMIARINAAAAANGVVVSHISFQSAGAPILVAGTAQSETQIAAFQNAIQNDPRFGTVNLPLLNIQGTSGAYTFSMTFPLSSSGF
jgi:Tfp pilus assembly PilM family ATPase